MFKDFYKGSTIIFIGLLFGKLFAMTNNVLMARLLTAHYYGIFLLGLTVFNFIVIPSNLGVPSLLPKFISESNARKEFSNLSSYASQGLFITFLFSSILMLATFFLSEWISDSLFHSAELVPVIKVVCFAVPFNVSIAVLISIHRGLQNNYTKVILQDISSPTSKCILFIVLFYLGFNLKAAYFSFTSTEIIIFFISLLTVISALQLKSKSFLSFNTDIIRKILKLSWPLSIQSFIWIIYSQIDRVFIGYFLTPSHVAIYVASFSIVLLLSFLPQSFAFQALPMFSKIRSSNDPLMYKLAYKKIAKILFLVSFPLLVCISIFSKEIITVLYGRDYIDGALALVILNLGYFSRCIIGPASESLVSMEKTKKPMLASLFGCIANVILNAVLIPKFGIYGAAVGTSISIVVSEATMGYFNYKYIRIIPFDGSYIIWAVACIVLGIAVFVLYAHLDFGWLLLNIASICTIYLVISYSILFIFQKFMKIH